MPENQTVSILFIFILLLDLYTAHLATNAALGSLPWR